MGDKGDASKLGASQPALVIGGVNPSGRKKRASFPPSARKLPPSAAAPTASNNNNNGGGMGGAHEGHGLSDAERAKIHGKINGAKALEASEKMRVVYVDGAWDMFHAGHVEFLQRAAELGDFLLVGVHV